MEGLKKGILVKNGVAVGAVGDKYFSNAPIGVIQAFSGTIIPHGYLLANGASYPTADYPDLYAVIGNTYGGDTENFNVPNLCDGRFLEGSNISGEYVEAGLPNITGTFYHDPNVTSTLSGAFFSYTRGKSRNLQNDAANAGSGYVSFDASKSNAIYGNSNTVQPKSLRVLYIIKAFHTNEGVDSGVSDDVIEYVNNSLVDKADKSYVDDNFATMDKVDNISLIYNQNTDILAYALTCPQEKRTLVRIYSANATNNPYGVSTDTDFIYEIDKINFNDLFITVRAKDVKNNREFINTKNETKWSGWKELATMDKVVKYPDWSNQQTISQTEITVDQDVYIELNQLSSSPIEALKINGKNVSVSDTENGFYSTRFSGYVKKGSFVSYPYLTDPNIVRVFPLV